VRQPPPSQPSPNTTTSALARLTPPLTVQEAPSELSTLPEPANKIEAAPREEPQTHAKMSPSPSEDILQPECWRYSTKKLRGHFLCYVCCGSCRGPSDIMKWIGCRSFRVDDIETYTNCTGSSSNETMCISGCSAAHSGVHSRVPIGDTCPMTNKTAQGYAVQVRRFELDEMDICRHQVGVLTVRWGMIR
jgi:hypothetical protein